MSATSIATALPYYGGKARTGVWIASRLPMRHAYVEPFAGMLGTLLARPPSKQEVVNDINDNLVAWWRCLRDNPEELERRVSMTPKSRTEFDAAKKIIKDNSDADEMTRAWAMDTILRHGISARTDGRSCVGYRIRSGKKDHWPHERFDALTQRMRNVQIENKDGAGVLEFTARTEDVVVYCDPPYYSAERNYVENHVDVDRLTEALLAQRGACAISGYGTEWDHLGWRREQRDVACTVFGGHGKRTEILWMNYPLTGTTTMDMLA